MFTHDTLSSLSKCDPIPVLARHPPLALAGMARMRMPSAESECELRGELGLSDSPTEKGEERGFV